MNASGLGGESPVADAGRNVITAADTTVVLDGSRSYDPDGKITLYKWTRLPDNKVLCFGAQPTCETKALGRAEEVIELKVYDNYGNVAADAMSIINPRVRRPVAVSTAE